MKAKGARICSSSIVLPPESRPSTRPSSARNRNQVAAKVMKAPRLRQNATALKKRLLAGVTACQYTSAGAKENRNTTGGHSTAAIESAGDTRAVGGVPCAASFICTK